MMLGALWLAAALTAAPQTAVALDDNSKMLVSRPQHEGAIISPNGKLLAVVEHAHDTSFIVIVNVADLSVVKTISTGERTAINSLVWVGSNQVVARMTHFTDRYNQFVQLPDGKGDNPTLHLGYIDKSSEVNFHGMLIGTIPNDDHHVLIDYCLRVINRKCKTQARLVDTNNISPDGGDVVAEGPIYGAKYMADHAGVIRVAWALDDNDQMSVYVTNNGKDWKPLNDSTVSGVKMYPNSISRDNRSLFLIVEHKEGPNSFDRYDFATGMRTQLLRDAVTNPLGKLLSLDGYETLGAFFGTGRPEARFIDPNSQDAIWRAWVFKAFPDATTNVTSVSTDGNLMVIHTLSDRDPGTYYLLDRRNHKARLLFRSYAALDPKHQLPSEPFTMRARDGLVLTGFVTRPTGHAGPAPMIVLVHGGPNIESDSWYFDNEVQLLAQHGYAVLRVNYRGSYGFGRSFYQLGYRQWGAAMQDDVTDATHWAINQGIADAKRICIYGSNYGGYAAFMGAVREPTLYRCVAANSAVYDLSKISRWYVRRETPMQATLVEELLGNDSKQLADRSPLTHASDIKVPVLIAHTRMNGTAPIYIAELMRDALAKSGNAPVYLDYTDEFGGLEKDDQRIDFYGHLLGFFDANLGVSQSSVVPRGQQAASP
ncbi:S9 family peptidase [Dyella jejuensis]|uniref:S9 family peptidase n=1 Tax=Dyella jejuensis TaxID=1432009 RepID=A0ABW8JIZ1_9GAMM